LEDFVERVVVQISQVDGSLRIQAAGHNRAIDKDPYLIAQRMAEGFAFSVGRTVAVRPFKGGVSFEVNVFRELPSVGAGRPWRGDVDGKQLSDLFVLSVVLAAFVPKS
jgi:hypothetical protein